MDQQIIIRGYVRIVTVQVTGRKLITTIMPQPVALPAIKSIMLIILVPAMSAIKIRTVGIP